MVGLALTEVMSMMQKQKKPRNKSNEEPQRTKGKTAGDTESKASRPKWDHKGQGRSGAKARRRKGE
jgi:hypothetical protein